MDQGRGLIPAPAWALADAIDQAWTVVAAWVFGLSALVGGYMALTGIARGDTLQALSSLPAAVLLLAAAVVDGKRPWTLRLGVVAGWCGALIWIAALLNVPASDVGTTLPLAAFAAVSLLSARAFTRRRRGDDAAPQRVVRGEESGWIEEVA